MLADFHGQANKPFEHEARLKELLTKQAELNNALDLDKSEQQTAQESPEEKEAPQTSVETGCGQ